MKKETTVINVPLLEKVMSHIEAHPDEWNQDMWVTTPDSKAARVAETEGRTFCGTAYCFAGHTLHMLGYEFNTPEEGGYHTIAPDGKIRGTSVAAAEELGLDMDHANYLFNAGNSIETLRDIVDECVARAEL